MNTPEFSSRTRSDADLLAGKRVLVTGGTTGIGRAVAAALAQRGGRVLIFGREERALEEALAEIRGSGAEAHGITADASRLDDLRRVFSTVDEQFGGLDILVNNAAVTRGKIRWRRSSTWSAPTSSVIWRAPMRR